MYPFVSVLEVVIKFGCGEIRITLKRETTCHKNVPENIWGTVKEKLKFERFLKISKFEYCIDNWGFATTLDT